MPIFTPWYGGDCPVAPDASVEITCRNGAAHVIEAGSWGWTHFQDILDIVEYRVLRRRNRASDRE